VTSPRQRILQEKAVYEDALHAQLKALRRSGIMRCVPVLIYKGVHGKHTLTWKCSTCNEPFSLESMFTEPSTAELKEIDRTFQVHCEQRHPGSPVVGLPLAG